jgi:hypothetical protein
VTTSLAAKNAPTADVLRAASRAWFAAGVRHGDRRRLATDLARELDAADAHGAAGDVLGTDPVRAAREWAEAQDVTDRRLRMIAIVPAALLAALLAAGTVLVLVYEGFHDNATTVLSRMSPAGLLGAYFVAGLLSYAAMLAATGVVLSSLGDKTARASVRMLAKLMPIGSIIAVVAGIVTAYALGFGAVRATPYWVCGLVLAIVIATMTVARYLAVRHRPTA